MKSVQAICSWSDGYGAQSNEYYSTYIDPTGTLKVSGPNSNSCLVFVPDIWLHNNRIGNGNIVLRPGLGNIGLGTVDPKEKLHIFGFTRWGETGQSTQYLNIGFNGTSTINSHGGDLHINDLSQKNVQICENGGVVTIGQVTPISGQPHKLYVRGGIRTEAVKVDFATGIWADYVFEKQHKRLNLNELEIFIKTNKHLPNIPTSSEVEKNGIDLVEMNAKLLEKIEELNLYIIELNNRLETLESVNK